MERIGKAKVTADRWQRRSIYIKVYSTYIETDCEETESR